MKKGNRPVVLSIILVLFMTMTLSAAQVIPLTNSSRQAEMPFVLVLPNGDILVTYNEGEGFGIDSVIYYTIYSKTRGSWSNAKVAAARRNSAAYSQMAVDTDGIVHMSYFDGTSSGNREIFYTNYNPGEDTWANTHLVYDSSGVNSSWSRIRIDDGKIYIVWTHNYDPGVGLTDVVMVVNDIGGSWPMANRITVSDTGQAASVHNFFDVRNNKVYCVWMDDDHFPENWALYYTEGALNTSTGNWNFGSSDFLFQTGLNQYYPSLTLDDSGTPHIIFSHKNGPFFHTRKIGNSFSGPQEISQAGCAFNLISFVTFKQGLLHSAWVESTAAGESMFYGRGLPDGTWATPIKIGDGVMPGYPCIDVDDEGVVHVVWSDGPPLDDDHRNIKYASVELPGTAPDAEMVVSQNAGLIPFTVNFDASGSTDSDGNIIDYRWDFGDETSGRGAVVSHTYNQRGKYSVLLSVIDNDLRVGTAKTTIVASSGEPIALFTISATTGMAPFFAAFDGSESVDADGSITSYAWNFGDGTNASGVTADHTYQTGGTYTVTLVVTDNEGKTGSATKSVVVFEKPMAVFTTSSVYGPQPHQVTLDASSSSDSDGNIVTYSWDFGDGLTGDGQVIVHTYSTPGIFTAILTVTDNDGYTGTATQTITVTKKPASPLNVEVKVLENKSFLHTEYINRVSWVENPQNQGVFTISSYNIYRKPKGASIDQYVFIGETDSNTPWYDNRYFVSVEDAENYDYTVTAVDDQGTESAIVSTSDSGFFRSLLKIIKERLGYTT